MPELEDTIEKMRKRIAKVDALSAELKGRIDNLDPYALTTALMMMHKDVTGLHSRMKLMILKVNVATEVVWSLRRTGGGEDLAVKVISAFDNPDAWWAKREHLTLAQWRDELST